MIAAWMLYCTGVAFLIGAAAAATERGGRLAGWSGRWVWAGAMLATLGLPLLARSRPAAFATIEVPLQPSPTVAAAYSEARMAQTVVPPAPAEWSWADLDRPLALLWGALSLGLLAFGTAGALRLRDLRRGWRGMTLDGTPVLVSSGLGPAVVGVLRSQLVVPAWALDLDPRGRELVLAHEREHVRAGDPRLLAAGAVLLLLMPWNLPLWWQWRRLRLAVEMDCDARVLRRHPDRERYGRLLLEVSRRAARSLVPVAAFHEPMSLLERRIRAIAAGTPRRLLWHGLVSVGATVLFIVVACEAPRPVGVADVASGNVAPSTRGVVDSLIAEELRPLIRENLDRYYPGLLRESSGPALDVWFGHDSQLRVTHAAMLARQPQISGEAIHHVFPDFRPGHDGWGVVDRLALRGLVRDNVRVVWVYLDAGQHDLSALEQHPEMTTLPWVRDAIRRYFPEYIGHEPERPVDLVFIADPDKRVLRTLRAIRTSSAATREVLRAWTQDLPATAIAKVTVTTFGSGLVSKRVRVIWVETRPGVRVPATTPQELPSGDVTRTLMRGGVERYFPRYARAWAGRPVALQFWARTNGTVVKTATSNPGFGLRAEYQLRPSDAGRQPVRPALWAEWGYPLGESRHDVRVDWYWVPGSQ
jgi:BlaR1 peptidase M56